MPWRETSPVEQRERFIRDHRLELSTMAELCTRYGISRKTGYKWLARFEDSGRQGLADRRRAPHQCPHRITPEVAAVICAARRPHPSWGPAKLLAWLEPRHPVLDLPAISTAGDLLARRGLVKKRRRRRPYRHPGVVPPTTTQPNDLWTRISRVRQGSPLDDYSSSSVSFGSSVISAFIIEEFSQSRPLSQESDRAVDGLAARLGRN